MKLLFWLFKSKAQANGLSPIYVRITIDGEREQFSTGVLSTANQWNPHKQRISGRTDLSREKNEALDRIEGKLWQVYNELTDVFIDVTSEDVKQNYIRGKKPKAGIIELFEELLTHIKALVGTDYTQETLELYKRTLKHLKAFTQFKFNTNDIPVTRIKRSFMEEFIFFLKTEKQHGNNTIYKHCQRVNKVLNRAVLYDHLQKNPCKGITVRKQTKEITYLSKDELMKLEVTKMPSERLERIRDLFLFQCFTGLAYIDLFNLNRGNIERRENGELWIVQVRQKTSRTFKVPLLPKALDLMRKYNEPSLNKEEKVFPVPTNQKYNAYLKEIGKLCSIEKPLVSHLARRTFACTVTLMNGVPLSSVSSMLGHAKWSTTQLYSKVLDEKLKEDMDMLKLKLG